MTAIVTRANMPAGWSAFHDCKAERRARYFRYEYRWRLQTCGACNGSGYYDDNGSPRCSSCGGTGKERYQRPLVNVLPPEKPVVVKFLRKGKLYGRQNICCWSGFSSPLVLEVKPNMLLSVAMLLLEAEPKKERHKDRDWEPRWLMMFDPLTMHPDYAESVPETWFKVLPQ